MELAIFGNTRFLPFILLRESYYRFLPHDIKYYLTLTDLVHGKTLIKNVFGKVNFDSYNPLTNLEWNEKDRIWMNHKQYNEDFKAIYPDLFFGQKRDKEY